MVGGFIVEVYARLFALWLGEDDTHGVAIKAVAGLQNVANQLLAAQQYAAVAGKLAVGKGVDAAFWRLYSLDDDGVEAFFHLLFQRLEQGRGLLPGRRARIADTHNFFVAHADCAIDHSIRQRACLKGLQLFHGTRRKWRGRLWRRWGQRLYYRLRGQWRYGSRCAAAS